MRLCQIWNSSHFHSAQSRAAVLIYNPAALGLYYKSYCISALLQRDDICVSRAYHTALPLQLYQDLKQGNMLWDSLPLVCLPNPAWPLLKKHTISSDVQTAVAENNLGLDYPLSPGKCFCQCCCCVECCKLSLTFITGKHCSDCQIFHLDQIVSLYLQFTHQLHLCINYYLT